MSVQASGGGWMDWTFAVQEHLEPVIRALDRVRVDTIFCDEGLAVVAREVISAHHGGHVVESSTLVAHHGAARHDPCL
jgi:hypothetical protein